MAHQSLNRAFNELRGSLIEQLACLVGSVATAEDLAQEAYLRAAASGNAGAEASKALLHRTAVNLAIDHLRRQRLQHQIFAVGFDPETAASVAATQRSPEGAAGDRQ
jgi:DNA-directed RNA polymerase specialized sigma24 family protein